MRKNKSFLGSFSVSLIAAFAIGGVVFSNLGPSTAAPADKAPAKAAPAADKDKDAAKKDPARPDVNFENSQTVQPEDLVGKPGDYLGKNVKFTAKFYAFSNLALDYKPAMKPSKTYLSFLVLRKDSHVPLSELKIAMLIPKDKDPDTQLLTNLKDGDTIEAAAKVFSTALDDPWIEVYKLKKIGGSKDEDKKTASAADSKDETKAESKPEKSEEKPKSPAKN